MFSGVWGVSRSESEPAHRRTRGNRGRGLRGSPALASQAPCSAMGPGMDAALEAICPCPLRPPEPPRLDVARRGTCLLGERSNCQSCVPMFCVSIPLMSIYGFSSSHYVHRL